MGLMEIADYFGELTANLNWTVFLLIWGFILICLWGMTSMMPVDYTIKQKLLFSMVSAIITGIIVLAQGNK